jgi:hypothetical protein
MVDWWTGSQADRQLARDPRLLFVFLGGEFLDRTNTGMPSTKHEVSVSQKRHRVYAPAGVDTTVRRRIPGYEVDFGSVLTMPACLDTMVHEAAHPGIEQGRSKRQRRTWQASYTGGFETDMATCRRTCEHGTETPGSSEACRHANRKVMLTQMSLSRGSLHLLPPAAATGTCV